MTQSRQSQVSLSDTPYYGLNWWMSTLSSIMQTCSIILRCFTI